MRHFLLILGSCWLWLACSVQQTTDFTRDASSDAHSAGGFPGKENCENAVDDDDDGLIDCADDECFTYTCAASVPEGWTGPVALYMGSDAPPECPQSGGFTDLALEGGLLETPAFTCPTCTCNPTGVACTPSSRSPSSAVRAPCSTTLARDASISMARARNAPSSC